MRALFCLIVELAALLGGAALKISLSTELQTTSSLPCGELVIGYSTGHVGTTTLSSSQPYMDGSHAKVKDIAFFFEIGRMRKRRNATLKDEEQHVRGKYFGAIRSQLKGEFHKTCVDLSHMNLYFIRGLLSVLRADRVPYRLVRIRRDAVEVARSFEAQGKPWVFYSPYDSEPALPVSSATYDRFDPLQKRLWMVDETEARWRRDVGQEDRHRALQVFWAKAGAPGGSSLANAARPIAELLGLSAKESPPNSQQHLQRQEDEKDRVESMASLKGYIDIMRKECEPWRSLGGAALVRLKSAPDGAKSEVDEALPLPSMQSWQSRAHGGV